MQLTDNNWCTVAEILLVLYVVVQLVRIFIGDCDLQLQWAEKFGKPKGVLARKVVWITGASSGIGEHLAYALARAGCRLVLTSRREEELNRVKKGCLSSGSVLDDDIMVLPLDLLKFENHKPALDTALEKFHQVDILVNNAGVFQKELARNTDIEVDRLILEINVLSVISLTKVVLPHMLERKEGHIVAVSSTAGKFACARSVAYAGSKYAIQGYMDSLRPEVYGDNITVTSICPGPVVTNLLMNAVMGTPDKIMQEKMELIPRRMTASRCGDLCAVAICNKLEEVWIAKRPVLIYTYIGQYIPSLLKWYFNKIGA